MSKEAQNLESSADSSPESTENAKKPKLEGIVSGANELSVGISLVVAVLLGIGLGMGLEYLSGYKWTFWLGVFWGIAAAILNLYKAYKRQMKEAESLANNPRYTYKQDN